MPYVATVWDLQHRQQPFFPEVLALEGAWEPRERAYRSSLPRASRIITGTQTGKNEIVACYGVVPDNVFVVPLPTAVPEADLGLAEGRARRTRRQIRYHQ